MGIPGDVKQAVAVFYFGATLDWPAWVTWWSPFEHVARRPAVTHGDGMAHVALWALALGGTALGVLGYRRRAIG